jgi:hypothetical protein
MPVGNQMTALMTSYPAASNEVDITPVCEECEERPDQERHLDCVERFLATRASRWREERPDQEEWARSFVELLVEANDSELDRLLYAATPIAETSSRVATLVKQLSHEVAFHLRRFGQREDTAMRARVLVVATLSLVHEVVLPLPKGMRRRLAATEVVRLVRLGTDARG